VCRVRAERRATLCLRSRRCGVRQLPDPAESLELTGAIRALSAATGRRVRHPPPACAGGTEGQASRRPTTGRPPQRPIARSAGGGVPKGCRGPATQTRSEDLHPGLLPVPRFTRPRIDSSIKPKNKGLGDETLAAAMLTAILTTFSEIVSTSPVCTPARTCNPRCSYPRGHDPVSPPAVRGGSVPRAGFPELVVMPLMGEEHRIVVATPQALAVRI
jgi:hypothetical protein